MRIALTLIGLFYCWVSYAQTTINGRIVDEQQLPIAGANVIIYQAGTTKLLSYAISDEEGRYQVSFTTLADSILLEVSLLGYAKKQQSLRNTNQTIHLTLAESAEQLKEIVVKAPPIVHSNDTVSYNVSSFQTKDDRVIADVLAKLPGIEILDDGRILYQGRPIQKYYIEGLDLLKGKYNLANQNLPAGTVEQVQILENHQPIQILDSIQFSDEASLNIKLRNDVTVTGSANLGAGVSPTLWSANVTPMLFTAKHQMLSSYQTNNIGENVADQLTILTLEDLLSRFEMDTQKPEWLSIQQAQLPNFSDRRWLDNRVHLLTTNYLHRLRNQYDFSLNLAYLNDRQQQRGGTITKFYLPNDTIILNERINNQLFTNFLETEAVLEKNVKNRYLKNSLKFQGYWDRQAGVIEQNSQTISQTLSNPYFNLSNTFNTFFSVGTRKLINLQSSILLSETPQQLIINPGQFTELLTGGIAYDQTEQELDLKQAATHTALQFNTSLRRISLNPSLGIHAQQQRLNSRLTTNQKEIESPVFQNNLSWLRLQPYIDLESQFSTNRWRFTLRTPINLNYYRIEDKPLATEQQLNRLTFNPKLKVVYEPNAFWKFTSGTELSNRFGQIDQAHQGYLLINYRNIQRINAPLPEVTRFTLNSSIGYRNPLNSVFGHIIYGYSREKHNLLYTNRILENSQNELNALVQSNYRQGHTLSGRAGTYLSRWRTDVTFGSSFSVHQIPQLLNDVSTTVQYQTLLLDNKIFTKISNQVNLTYKVRWRFSSNQVQTRTNQTVQQLEHQVQMNLFPATNHLFRLNGEYIHNRLINSKTTNVFADLLYRYTWTKKRLDFELEVTNLFNNDDYQTVQVNTFSYLQTDLALRPTQVLVKVRFSL
jgi:hypothetical protein